MAIPAALRCVALLVLGGLLAYGVPPGAPRAQVPETPFLMVETGTHRAIINDLAISPNGDVVATASDDKTLRLWSLSSGTLLDTFRPPIGQNEDGLLYTTAFSPSGKFLLAGGYTGLEWDGQGYVYLFGLPDGELKNRRLPIPGVIQKIDYLTDDQGRTKYLAIAYSGNQQGIVVFDGKVRKVKEDLEFAGRPTWVEFGSDGRLYAVAEDGFLRIYAEGLELVYRDRVAGREPSQVRPSPDGRHLAIAYLGSKHIDLHDARSGKALRQLSSDRRAGIPYLGAVAWLAKGSGRELWAAGGIKDDEGRTLVRRWFDPLESREHQDIAVARDAITRLEATADGEVIYASADPSWGLIDSRGEIVHRQLSNGGDFRAIFDEAFSLNEDGTRLRFFFRAGGEEGALDFDVRKQALRPLSRAEAVDLLRPRPPAALTEWRNSSRPLWQGKPVPLETGELARSAASTAEGGAVLGADRNLYLLDGQGSITARRPLPATAWAVAVAEDGSKAVAALGDGTFRWYQPEGPDPLVEIAALFVHRDRMRWLLWTPDGYFSHSNNGGQKLAGYHSNRGAKESGQWADFAQLYRKFYDPILVQRRLGIVPKVAVVDQTQTNAGADTLEEAPAPSIRLIEFCPREPGGRQLDCVPADLARRGFTRIKKSEGESQASTSDEQLALPANVDQVLVRFEIRSPLSIASFDAFVNGRTTGQATRGFTRVKKQSDETAADGVEALAAQRLVTLADGMNVIEIRAYDERGIFGRSKELALSANLKSRAEPPPRLLVLSVGVNRYEGDIPALSFARLDAESISGSLEQHLPDRYSEVRVVEVLDQEATRAGIERAFEALASQASSRDSVVIYLAGHGILNEKDGAYHYLPVDVGSWDDIQTSGLSQSALIQMLGQVPSANTLVMIDTCHSGAFPANAPGNFSNETGFFVLAASASVQEALDGYNGRNGVFAHAVLEGIEGEAANRQGLVDATQLGLFVRDRVEGLAAEKNFRQQAEFSIAAENLKRFPIAQID